MNNLQRPMSSVRKRATRVSLFAALALALAGGVAYATIYRRGNRDHHRLLRQVGGHSVSHRRLGNELQAGRDAAHLEPERRAGDLPDPQDQQVQRGGPPGPSGATG